jgi:hypothetical protein
MNRQSAPTAEYGDVVMAFMLAIVIDCRSMLLSHPECWSTNYAELVDFINSNNVKDDENLLLESTLIGHSLRKYRKGVKSLGWMQERDTGAQYRVPGYPAMGLKEITQGDKVIVPPLDKSHENYYSNRAYEGQLTDIANIRDKLLSEHNVDEDWKTSTLSELLCKGYRRMISLESMLQEHHFRLKLE